MNAISRRRAALLWFVAATAPSMVLAAPPMDLAALLGRAAEHNPELKAARARWQAVRHQAVAARKWPEPVVSGGVFVRPVETRVGPQRARVGIRMPIPWPHKLQLKGDAVLARADVARRRIDARLARLEAQIRRPWVQRTWLLQVASLYEAQRTLLVNLEPSLLTRLRVGKATFADAQRLRLMIDALAERAASARDAVSATEAQLRALANVPADVPLAPGGFESDPFAGAAPPPASAFTAALAKQPDVLVGDAAVAAAVARTRAAQQKTKPDFGVGLDWVMVGAARMDGVSDSGNDALMLNVSAKLPVWRRAYTAEVDAARATHRAATATREAALRRAEARVAKLLFRLRDARRKRALYAGQLVPRAKSALQTVVRAYATGRAGFQSVIELQRQLLRYQVRLSTARRRRVQAQADLEALIAGPLAPFALRQRPVKTSPGKAANPPVQARPKKETP
ncbi:MAG: TolC family protein [Myxococcales bacterium]|nr:TolC family protein [Myxococcales bacterium]